MTYIIIFVVINLEKLKEIIFNEFKIKRDYFSNFPFKLNKSDNLNNLIQKK